MTLAAATRAGRLAAERNMVDACTVSTVEVAGTDPLTGEPQTTRTTVYEGRCKVQTFEPQEHNPESAGGLATVQRYAVHVPVGSFEPRVGHVVEIVSAALDPHLTGREFRVVALLHKTAATAYRLGVEEVS